MSLFANRLNRVIFYLAALLVLSCRKEPCPENLSYHFLTDGSRKFVPYNGCDTLIFINDADDTLYYQGLERYSHIFTEYQNDFGECGAGYRDFLEKERLLFIRFNTIQKDSLIINLNTVHGGATRLTVEKSGEFFIFSLDISRKPYFDSLLVNGNMYYDVFDLDSYSKINMYHNRSFGILSFYGQNSIVWSLP